MSEPPAAALMMTDGGTDVSYHVHRRRCVFFPLLLMFLPFLPYSLDHCETSENNEDTGAIFLFFFFLSNGPLDLGGGGGGGDDGTGTGTGTGMAWRAKIRKERGGGGGGGIRSSFLVN